MIQSTCYIQKRCFKSPLNIKTLEKFFSEDHTFSFPSSFCILLQYRRRQYWVCIFSFKVLYHRRGSSHLLSFFVLLPPSLNSYLKFDWNIWNSSLREIFRFLLISFLLLFFRLDKFCFTALYLYLISAFVSLSLSLTLFIIPLGLSYRFYMWDCGSQSVAYILPRQFFGDDQCQPNVPPQITIDCHSHSSPKWWLFSFSPYPGVIFHAFTLSPSFPTLVLFLILLSPFLKLSWQPPFSMDGQREFFFRTRKKANFL